MEAEGPLALAHLRVPPSALVFAGGTCRPCQCPACARPGSLGSAPVGVGVVVCQHRAGPSWASDPRSGRPLLAPKGPGALDTTVLRAVVERLGCRGPSTGLGVCVCSEALGLHPPPFVDTHRPRGHVCVRVYVHTCGGLWAVFSLRPQGPGRWGWGPGRGRWQGGESKGTDGIRPPSSRTTSGHVADAESRAGSVLSAAPRW